MTERRGKPVGDRDLAEAVLRNGDERAFRVLYRRHTPRLYRFVLRMVGGVEMDAEDVVQETWLRACRRLDRFRWESEFSTWLHGIGIHVARDLLRRRAPRDLPLGETPDEASIPRPALEDRIDLERIIAGLPDGYREVLVLHDIEGMKHREIAEHLGISVGTSKSQLSDARRVLRGHLASARGRDDG